MSLLSSIHGRRNGGAEGCIEVTSPHRASLWPNSSKYPECQENPWTRTTAAFVRFPAPHTCADLALLSSICCIHNFPHFESRALPCSGDQLLLKSLKEDLLSMGLVPSDLPASRPSVLHGIRHKQSKDYLATKIAITNSVLNKGKRYAVLKADLQCVYRNVRERDSSCPGKAKTI